jgi:hypothetical protein
MNNFEPILKYSHGDILKWIKTNIISVYVKIENNKVIFKTHGSNYTERLISVQKMIQDTLLIHQVNDVELIINVTDNPFNNPYILHYSKTIECNINVVPFFSFYKWSDAKSSDFFETKKEILNNNVKWVNKENMIMWSGVNSSKIREKMNTIKHMKTNTIKYFYNLIISYHTNHIFIYLKDHTKYKYLLDMEGVGYAGRFPYLSLTGSCVIILENMENQYKYYYDNIFIENVHYLKVQYSKTDLENMEIIHNKIIDKISMYDCEEIGKKCQSLAIEVFSKDKILEYYKDLLNYYSTFYDKSNQEFNKDLMYSIKHIDKRKMIHLLNQFNNK